MDDSEPLTISSLKALLERVIEEHGDLPVCRTIWDGASETFLSVWQVEVREARPPHFDHEKSFPRRVTID